MANTSLLPPIKGVEIVWARTSQFSKGEQKHLIDFTIDELKRIRKSAEKNAKENAYVSRAILTMDACLHNIHIVYKGRNLNYDDNDKLRGATIELIKEYSKFGNSVKDQITSLPGLLTGSGVGASLGYLVNGQNFVILGLALIFAGIGDGVYIFLKKRNTKHLQRVYIQQDCERTLYYKLYLKQVEEILISLGRKLNQLHKDIFGVEYPDQDMKSIETMIDNMIQDVRPQLCKDLDDHFWKRYLKKSWLEKHFYKGFLQREITPKRWPVCEARVHGISDMCGYHVSEDSKK